MTIAAATALQKGIFGALTASADVAAASGGIASAYDRVPPNPPLNYFTIADAQLLDDGDTCEENQFEAFADIHVWSREVGQVTAKNMASAARKAILAGLTMEGWVHVAVAIESIRHFMDPDGTTAHGVITARFLLQPA